MLHNRWDFTSLYMSSLIQTTVENLKAENDQLKTGVSRPPSSTSQSSGLGSLGTSSPRQSVASLSKAFSMGAAESLNTGEGMCTPYLINKLLHKTEDTLYALQLALAFQSAD